MDVRKKLQVLREEWSDCSKCALYELRVAPQIVFGAGPAPSDFLLVTDAPSEGDVESGTTLSGEDGRVVSQLLESAGLSLKSVYRTPLVGCQPYVVLPATEDAPSRAQDRDPLAKETEACRARLHQIIYLVDPRIIIAMGDGPWKTLVPHKDRGNKTTIAAAAGNLFDTWVPGKSVPVRYPVMATLSPRQIAAHPSVADHGPIASTMEALQRAAQYVSWLNDSETA